MTLRQKETEKDDKLISQGLLERIDEGGGAKMRERERERETPRGA